MRRDEPNPQQKSGVRYSFPTPGNKSSSASPWRTSLTTADDYTNSVPSRQPSGGCPGATPRRSTLDESHECRHATGMAPAASVRVKVGRAAARAMSRSGHVRRGDPQIESLLDQRPAKVQPAPFRPMSRNVRAPAGPPRSNPRRSPDPGGPESRRGRFGDGRGPPDRGQGSRRPRPLPPRVHETERPTLRVEQVDGHAVPPRSRRAERRRPASPGHRPGRPAARAAPSPVADRSSRHPNRGPDGARRPSRSPGRSRAGVRVDQLVARRHRDRKRAGRAVVMPATSPGAIRSHSRLRRSGPSAVSAIPRPSRLAANSGALSLRPFRWMPRARSIARLCARSRARSA